MPRTILLHGLLYLVLARQAWAAPIQVYIIAGQSNATGGAWPPYPPDDLLPPQDSLYSYKLRGDAGFLESRGWEQVRTLWPSSPHNVSFGVEITFADEMHRRTGQPIAIIKVSQNGSNLFTQWRPTVQDIYPWFIEKVHSALAELEQPHEVAGLLWIQGETDATWDFWAGQYEESLSELITQIREDLDKPTLPVALNLLHAHGSTEQSALLRTEQLQFAKSDQFTWHFDPSDLPIAPDGLHYPNESFLELGRRFADLFVPSGDFNRDGAVDSADLALWTASHGTFSQADSDGDGLATGNDFLLWQRQVRLSTQPKPAPEPATIVLTAMGALLLVRKRRRRSAPDPPDPPSAGLRRIQRHSLVAQLAPGTGRGEFGATM